MGDEPDGFNLINANPAWWNWIPEVVLWSREHECCEIKNPRMIANNKINHTCFETWWYQAYYEISCYFWKPKSQVEKLAFLCVLWYSQLPLYIESHEDVVSSHLGPHFGDKLTNVLKTNEHFKNWQISYCISTLKKSKAKLLLRNWQPERCNLFNKSCVFQVVNPKIHLMISYRLIILYHCWVCY